MKKNSKSRTTTKKATKKAPVKKSSAKKSAKSSRKATPKKAAPKKKAKKKGTLAKIEQVLAEKTGQLKSAVDHLIHPTAENGAGETKM